MSPRCCCPYGVPESDIVTVVYTCNTKTKRVDIVTTVLPAKKRRGQPLRTTLCNGNVIATYDRRIGYDASTKEYHFEVSAMAEPKVLDVLKSGASLTIGIPGHHERVPLRGAAKPLARFEAACFRKR